MAQQPTGLGWSAEETYLTQAAGIVLGNYGGLIADPTVYVGQPIPSGAIQYDDPVIISSGFLAGEGDHPRGYWHAGIKFMSADDNTVYLFRVNDTIYVVTASSTTVYYNVYNMNTLQLLNGSVQSLSLDVSTGLYYGRNAFLNDYGSNNQSFYVPNFASIADGLASVSRATATITKLNAGVCTAAWVKFHDINGNEQEMPILISSESTAVDMSEDGSSVASIQEKITVRNDGITFYMSYLRSNPAPFISSPLTVANILNFPALKMEGVFAALCREDWENITVTDTVDPYEDFGNTGEDAGEINPDPEDDDVDFDDLPTKGFAAAGFCRIFNPDTSDLNALASYMWTDQSFLQTVINHLKQILGNPIEAIISLSMVPVQPPRGSSKVPVNVMFVNTGVSMYPVTSQFVSVDCGTLKLQECYGGALDYNPYTRVQIYLPYIGIVQLDTDEVMAKTLHLKYNIDVVTGICCAEIKADDKLLYSFSGHCAVSQPITSADFSSYLNAAVAAAKVAVGVATGMASTSATAAAAEIPPAAPSKAPTSSALVPLQSSGAIGPHLGSPGMSGSRGWTDFSDIAEPQSSGGVSWGELTKPGNANTVASAMGGKMVVQHSGGFSGNSGYLAKRRPYLIIIRPRIANPRNYAQHFGRTSMEYLNLGSCTGYTKVQSVHLSGFDATNPELSEISSLLKGGVLM